MPSSDVEVEEKFFLYICSTKRFGCNLRLPLMEEKQQTGECVFIQYCAEKTKSTKLEEKFWIKDCAQNEKSIFL